MKRILIIEDEESVRRNLEDLLEAEGFAVFSAKDGIDGYESALLKEPDLILSDIRMPRMDGFELLRKLQNNPVTRLIPFVFLTARADLNDLRKGMSTGADDYIIKPFKIDDVLNAINSRLRKKENYLASVKEFKDILMKRVPHELRTPLVGILGLSSYLCDDIENISKEEVKNIAERIRCSGKRLHRRIEKFMIYTELLDQSRNKEGDPELSAAECEIDPASLSDKLLNIADDFGRRNDLAVRFSKSRMKIDPSYFYTMLNELLENSLKFSQKGTTVSITGEPVESIYKIMIIDEGLLRKKIYLDDIKAFNKFGKEDLTDEGIGMGLAIVKKIIELHNGDIAFEKCGGKHSTVEIKIPVVTP